MTGLRREHDSIRDEFGLEQTGAATQGHLVKLTAAVRNDRPPAVLRGASESAGPARETRFRTFGNGTTACR